MIKAVVGSNDEIQMKEVSKFVVKIRADKMSNGFIQIPKEGMSIVRSKILSMKGKTLSSIGTKIRHSQIINAIAVFGIIVETIHQPTSEESKNWDDCCSYNSIKAIADQLGTSEKIVKVAVELLIEAGVLIRLYRKDLEKNDYRYFFYPVFDDVEIPFENERKETAKNTAPERTESSTEALEEDGNIVSLEEDKSSPEPNIEESDAVHVENTVESSLEEYQFVECIEEENTDNFWGVVVDDKFDPFLEEFPEDDLFSDSFEEEGAVYREVDSEYMAKCADKEAEDMWEGSSGSEENIIVLNDGSKVRVDDANGYNNDTLKSFLERVDIFYLESVYNIKLSYVS